VIKPSGCHWAVLYVDNISFLWMVLDVFILLGCTFHFVFLTCEIIEVHFLDYLMQTFYLKQRRNEKLLSPPLSLDGDAHGQWVIQHLTALFARFLSSNRWSESPLLEELRCAGGVL